MKTELNDRILWNDGTNQVNPEKVPELFLHGVPQDKIVVTSINEDIKRFNDIADEPILTAKEENFPLDMTWNIPEYYRKINLLHYCEDELFHRGLFKNEAYLNRLKLEVIEITDRKIDDLFRTLIYVVDVLRNEGKVWGVGRGSSCASLVLHLIGIHEVDPIKYGIPLSEFFHD